jgi:hypothetical protein
MALTPTLTTAPSTGPWMLTGRQVLTLAEQQLFQWVTSAHFQRRTAGLPISTEGSCL